MTSSETVHTKPYDFPPFATLVIWMAVSAGVNLILGYSVRTPLFWYLFPLYAIGVVYIWEIRGQLSRSWVPAFLGTLAVSIMQVPFRWPFSGHILWNVVLLIHACERATTRRRWAPLLVVSLVYLIVFELFLGVA